MVTCARQFEDAPPRGWVVKQSREPGVELTALSDVLVGQLRDDVDEAHGGHGLDPQEGGCVGGVPGGVRAVEGEGRGVAAVAQEEEGGGVTGPDLGVVALTFEPEYLHRT